MDDSTGDDPKEDGTNKQPDKQVKGDPASPKCKAKAKATPVKGSPKGKAKANALKKAVAKAKVKAKAKGKAKAIMKKPGKKENTPSVKGIGLKRPAAAKSKPKAESMADKFQKWKMAVKRQDEDTKKQEEGKDAEQGEEEAQEDDEEVEDHQDEKRNKYAAAKFNSLLKSGQIPAHIQGMWEKGNRQLKTQIVNSLFKQNSKTGKWEMNSSNPEFERIVKTQEEIFGKDRIESVPRSVMLHPTFRGDKEALDRAILDGEVIETEVNGRVLLGFQKVAAGKKRSNLDETKATSGQASLTHEGFNNMAELAAKFKWHNVGAKAIGDEASHSSGQKHSMLAIKDKTGVTWDTCEGVFQEAAAAQERLLKEAAKIQGQVAMSKDPTLIGQFKESYTAFKTNHNTLQEALLWKDRCWDKYKYQLK